MSAVTAESLKVVSVMPQTCMPHSHVTSEIETDDAKAKKESGLKRLFRICEREVVAYRASDGNAVVACADSPHLVYPIGSIACAPIAKVQVQYYNIYDEPATTAMVQNLRESLRAHTVNQTPNPVHIRAAREDDVIWLDTGWPDGEVIRISSDGWSIFSNSPVLFTRSPLMASVPDPRGIPGDLSRLNQYLHCAESDLPLVWATLLCTWFDGAPQPVFSLLGSADSGKSTAMRFLIDLVDPSTTQTGSSLTKDPRDFKALARTRRILAFDNVSGMDGSQSDLLARVSTGGELMSRALYTDDDAHVTQLMRPVWLNGIMSGFTRSDLASRAVMIELETISSESRLSSDELNKRWQLDRPVIFAGLLDLCVAILAADPKVKATGVHRLVEFEHIVSAIDSLHGTEGIVRLRLQTTDLSDTVLDATTLGAVLRTAIEEDRDDPDRSHRDLYPSPFGTFSTQEYMNLITKWARDDERRELPDSVKKFGETLTRLIPDLERVLEVKVSRTRVAGGRRGLIIEDLRK